jgi:hypothetical protein
MIFTVSGRSTGAASATHVVATRRGGPSMALRMVELSPGHYVAYPVFDPRTWRFTAVTTIDGRSHAFSIERVLS